MGLGHRVAGGDLAIEQRLQVALLLLLGAVVREDLGVAGVRRLAAEDRGRPARAAQHLVHQRELRLSVAGAAELGPQVAGPETPLLHLLLQRSHDLHRAGVGLVVGIVQHEVEGLDLVADESGHPVELALELGLGLEIPGHGGSFYGSRWIGQPVYAESGLVVGLAQRREALLAGGEVEHHRVVEAELAEV